MPVHAQPQGSPSATEDVPPAALDVPPATPDVPPAALDVPPAAPDVPPAAPDVPLAALDDLFVVDFSRVLAGPFATMMLGDLGARVVKVERPGSGDDTRSWGPPFDAGGTATYFDAVNRNKRSVALDLQDVAGRSRALRLIERADVLVENFRPGLMESFGLGHELLRERHPRLIYCSITGFGACNGQLPGYDLLVQALGGLMSITGEPDGPPQKVGVALVDVLCGLFATTGILAALRHRQRTGEGQLVEVDLLSSLLAALVNQASAHTIAGEVPRRMGNRHPSIAPYELLACSDGELVVAVGNDRQFARLCQVIGEPALCRDPRFCTNAARVANREALIGALQLRLRSAPAAHWAALMTAARVPAGTVNDVAQAFELARGLGLEPVVTAGQAEDAPRLARNPLRLSATPPSYRLAPPALGECSLADALGPGPPQSAPAPVGSPGAARIPAASPQTTKERSG